MAALDLPSGAAVERNRQEAVVNDAEVILSQHSHFCTHPILSTLGNMKVARLQTALADAEQDLAELRIEAPHSDPSTHAPT